MTDTHTEREREREREGEKNETNLYCTSSIEETFFKAALIFYER